MNRQSVEGMKQFLEGLGIDTVEGPLAKTPERVTRLFTNLFSGVGKDSKEIWGDVFATDYQGLVAVTDIPFYSVCEHHLMPFFGTVDIVYQSKDGRVAGLSKLAKLVELFARRPQLQERMTAEIADAVEKDLEASGVLVRIRAEHFCMLMLGEVKPGTKAVTFESRGLLHESGPLREEGLLLIQGGKIDVEASPL